MTDEGLILSEEELRRLSGVGRIAYQAYGRVRRIRFNAFLKSIGSVSDEMAEQERLRFERYVDSPDAQEWLADFADKAIRSRSRTAIAALAILLADPIDEQFGAEFAADAAHALEGISDRTIHAFVSIGVLSNAQSPRDSDGAITITNLAGDGLPVLARLGLSPLQWTTTIDDLVSRGMLGGRLQPSTASKANPKSTWERSIHFTDDSQRFARLLERARRVLGLPPIVLV